MKVAVTGASGFVGQYVLAELLNKNVQIVAVTRDKSKLQHFSDRVQIVELDLFKNAPDLFQLLGQPDILMHLAWDGLPNYKSSHHIDTELVNQYAFLRSMVEQGLKSLIVTGTCFEYGMQAGELSEETPTQPTNPYGLAKDTLRKQLQQLKESYDFCLLWARLFYMYGEGQSNSSLYFKFNEAIRRGDGVFNMSGGEQLRDYLPIEEVARILVHLALFKCDQIVNICSGKPISIRNLVEGWIIKNNSKIQMNLGYYPYPDYEPMSFWGSRVLLNKLLSNPR